MKRLGHTGTLSDRRNLLRASTYARPLPVLIRATEQQIRETDQTKIPDYAGLVLSLRGSCAVVNVADKKIALSAKAAAELAATLELRDGYETSDRFLVRRAVQRLRGPEAVANVGIVSFDHAMRMWVSETFDSRMRRARLVNWLNLSRGRLELAIFCRDLKTAAWVRAIVRDIRACPSCDGLFRPERPDRIYCSLACRERYRKRRLRAEMKGD